MKKGSITIFSILVMMLVASVLFVLLEGTRFNEIKRISQLQTELAVESAFANYNSALWNEYHLLACNFSEVEEVLVAEGNARLNASQNGLNLLLAEVEDITIEQYTLLTDGSGEAYIGVVSSYMKENFSYEIAKIIYNQYEATKNLQENTEWDMSKIDAALQGVNSASETTTLLQSYETAKPLTISSGLSAESEEGTLTENPLEEIKDLQNIGILDLVLEDKSQLSIKEIDLSEVVSKRNLYMGKNSETLECEWVDTVLLQQYLLNYMSNYCDIKDGRCMSYELEYLIGKNSSDIENLKSVATRLLAIREAANFLYLTTEPSKVETAQALAISLAGISANPILIEGVKIGLLTAWAFAESVLDVRALLQGKKIPLLKSDESWTIDLSDIGTLTQGYATAKESQSGISYKDYLGILLLFEWSDSLALCAMDMQEATVREKYEWPDFRMDELVVNAQVHMQYTYSPVFLDYYSLNEIPPWDFEIQTETTYGYY